MCACAGAFGGAARMMGHELKQEHAPAWVVMRSDSTIRVHPFLTGPLSNVCSPPPSAWHAIEQKL